MTAGAQQAGAVSHNNVDWNAINWRKVEANVRRLQARIVKATKAGRYNKVKVLQRLLTHSFSGRCLAVRRMTTNEGRNTPGVDGRIWKSTQQKAVAVSELRACRYKPQPLRRVYIPKSDGRRRGLNIPAMKDRAMQALYLLALDPIAETTADANSYGFRPGRSPADAIAQCFKALSRQSSAESILEADIRACFDTISHEWLLTNIPLEKKILRKWLKAGFIEEGHYHTTEIGAPQGGIISPVLMNLTLNGLECELSQRPQLRRRTPTGKRMKVKMVRFADDFIVTANSRELLETEVKPLIEEFLRVRGLELSPEKTKITHIGEGFDFLGQHLRKNRQGKLLIRPSAKSLRQLLGKVRGITRKHRHVSPGVLIWMLNPILKGWAIYHRHVASKQTFAKADKAIFEAVWRWCRRRHRRKSRGWVKQRYFHQVGNRDWVFSGELSISDKLRLVRLYCLAQTPIRRHTKIQGEANAYDPEWEEYFEQRLDAQTKGSLKGLKLLLLLWQQQEGLCPVCQQRITKQTGWRTHHLHWRAYGGSDRADNLVLLLLAGI